MYKGCAPSHRSAQDVLNRISQEQVFLQYLNIYPDLNKRFLSPFRNDKDPGCRFTWYSGILYFVENTAFNNRLYWSCIDVVKYIKNCSFQEALELIDTGQSSGNITRKFTNKLRPEIRFTHKTWPKNNLFSLDHNTLVREHVYLVQDYWVKFNDVWKKNSIHQNTLTIAYHFPKTDHVKLYFPEHLENRWYSNCTTEDIFGYDMVDEYASYSELLVIDKSQKDRLMSNYFLDLPAIAVQNEGCFIPENIMDELKFKFKHIVLMYDNDLTGIQQSQRLSEKYGVEYRIIECNPKDKYEMIQKFGVENTKRLIHSYL